MSAPSPRLVNRSALLLTGMSYFGDPFTSHAGWTDENEIGRLWFRLSTHLQLREMALPTVTYEVHVRGASSAETGEFEVFAGYEPAGGNARDLSDLPVELVAKALPAGTYAEVEVLASDLAGPAPVLATWLREAGYHEAGPFVVLRYDERFRGTEYLGESVVTFAMPVRPHGDPGCDVRD